MDNTIKGFDIADPIEMLLLVDDGLLNGKFTLHDWQMRIMKDFAAPSTSDKPYMAVVRAANGSGKDRYIIAPCAMWLGMTAPYSVSVITSSSGTQLDRQTNTYLKQIAEAINKCFGREIWKINYRHYENIETKATIELFVTDEAGRAEGWHPVMPDSQLAIFTSESKSIPEEIFHALARCTGFTKRVDVSSPGLPTGHFFNRCTSGNWRKYHITAFDCPHLSKDYIKMCAEDYGGETSGLFKSMVLAEFGGTDEQVVITYQRVYNAIFNTKVPWFKDTYNTAGVDLSAGGDETTLAVRNGNKLLKITGWRIQDTSRTIDHLETLFRENGLVHPEAYIFADVGGLGNPILWELKSKRGWTNIRFVDNRMNPRNRRAYYNLGTEMWFDFNKHLENNEILLIDDKVSREQLSSRYYKMREDGSYILESKLQARAKGHPSPDRADAIVLCYKGYKTRLSDEERGSLVKERPFEPPKIELPEQRIFTLKEHAERQNQNNEYSRFTSRSEQRQNIEQLSALVQEHNAMMASQRTQQQESTEK